MKISTEIMSLIYVYSKNSSNDDMDVDSYIRCDSGSVSDSDAIVTCSALQCVMI